MTVKEWYDQWAFGNKSEWEDLPAATKDYWERAFNEIIGTSNPNGKETRQEIQ